MKHSGSFEIVVFFVIDAQTAELLNHMNSTQRFNVHHPGLMWLLMNLKNRPAPTSILILFILMLATPHFRFGINPMAFNHRNLQSALVDGDLYEDTLRKSLSMILGRREAA
jgi:hypothetical protein